MESYLQWKPNMKSWAYQMVRLPVTLSVAVFSLCSIHNSENVACFNSICFHANWKKHTQHV